MFSIIGKITRLWAAARKSTRKSPVDPHKSSPWTLDHAPRITHESGPGQRLVETMQQRNELYEAMRRDRPSTMSEH